MINVNGRDFENYDEAIKFMQDEKIRTEEMSRKDNLLSLLNRTLNAVTVQYEDKNYIICTLSDAENRNLFPEAMLSKIMGPQYEVIENELIEKYIRLGNINSMTKPIARALRDYIIEKYEMIDKLKTVRLSTFKFNETEYEIYLYNYLNLENEESLKNDKECRMINNLETLLNYLFLQ